MEYILGIFLNIIGSFAGASFYLPFRKVRNWSWESYWIVAGFFTWVILPCLIAAFTIPNLLIIIRESPPLSILWTFIFGMLWGIGGHSFGLSLRYLGMSLGMAIALGMTHIAGTLAPPIFMGTFQSLIRSLSGQVIMAGLAVCIIGTFLAGFAGILKENDSSPDNKQKYIKEYNFKKGIIVTVLSGILSACFTFAFDASKPIADVAVKHGISELWKNNVGLVFITAGSFISNAILCLAMNIKNKSISNYWHGGDASIWINYLFSAAAGIIAYLEFLFYGMGITKMGKNDFVSFSIHLVFIIIFSTMWGWITLEFKGSSKRTVTMIIIGILVLILSVVVMAYGNYLSFIA